MALRFKVARNTTFSTINHWSICMSRESRDLTDAQWGLLNPLSLCSVIAFENHFSELLTAHSAKALFASTAR